MWKFMLVFVLLSVGVTPNLTAQKTDKKLQKSLEALIKDFQGSIGVYVKDLNKNKIVSLNADTVFPTASMVKIPILIGVMDKLHRGELQYNRNLFIKIHFCMQV